MGNKFKRKKIKLPIADSTGWTSDTVENLYQGIPDNSPDAMGTMEIELYVSRKKYEKLSGKVL